MPSGRSTRRGQGRPPVRSFSALFLGAGASRSAGLPLTEELLARIYPRAGGISRWHRQRTQAAWARELASVIRILYPSGDAAGYLPSVADFFTALEVIALVHEGRPRLAIYPTPLLRNLRREVALGLLSETASATSDIDDWPHTGWMRHQRRPNVVITSNWDCLVEFAALHADLRVYLNWPRDRRGFRKRQLATDEVVILKLHGSVDWGFAGERSVIARPVDQHYSSLGDPVGERSRFGRGAHAVDSPIRFRTLERTGPAALQLGFDTPLMATMAVGKHAQIDALSSVWDDAYWALARANRISAIGYSFPSDDLEIRTLLRTTTRARGQAGMAQDLSFLVCNPSPEAHDRARGFLGSRVRSDFRGADSFRLP